MLRDVPENILVTPLTNTSAFVGATSTQSLSRHVFKLGVIQDVRLLCLFRFKPWWMIPRVGNSGSDIPIETHMLLLEGQTCYILFLPLLVGQFRSSLQGNSSNELEFCLESGFWRNTWEHLLYEKRNRSRYSTLYESCRRKCLNLNDFFFFNEDSGNVRLVWLVHLGCFLSRCESSRNQRGPKEERIAIAEATVIKERENAKQLSVDYSVLMGKFQNLEAEIMNLNVQIEVRDNELNGLYQLVEKMQKQLTDLNIPPST